MISAHHEPHRVGRGNWLRAAVLGANDGIVSTSSLIVGFAAAAAAPREILLAGLAGMVAGALSMAAGEYVSVSSQADTEAADIARERRELALNPVGELEELTLIYVERGLDGDLARQVAVQLTDRDVLAAHVRDEIGITEVSNAQPVTAALSSAAAFAIGGVLPILSVLLAPRGQLIVAVGAVTLVGLALLGALGAKAGGASMGKAALRVTFWGVIAMAATAAVGKLFGVAVS